MKLHNLHHVGDPLSRPISAYSSVEDVIYVNHSKLNRGTTWFTAGCYPVNCTGWPDVWTIRRDLGKVQRCYRVCECYDDDVQLSGRILAGRAATVIMMQGGRVLFYHWEEWFSGTDSMEMREAASRDKKVEEMTLF